MRLSVSSTRATNRGKTASRWSSNAWAWSAKRIPSATQPSTTRTSTTQRGKCPVSRTSRRTSARPRRATTSGRASQVPTILWQRPLTTTTKTSTARRSRRLRRSLRSRLPSSCSITCRGSLRSALKEVSADFSASSAFSTPMTSTRMGSSSTKSSSAHLLTLNST